MKKHLTDSQLNTLIELSPGEMRNRPEYGHVDECEICGTRFRQLLRIHYALQRQVVAAADHEQVQRIMKSVRTGKSETFVWPLALRLAYFAAMLIVLGIIGFVFYQFNILDLQAFDFRQMGENGVFTGIYKTVQSQGEAMGKGIISVYNRLFGADTQSVFTFTVIFLALLALLDRWLLEPIFRRRY